MRHIHQFAVLIKRLVIFVVSLVMILVVYKALLPDIWQRNHTLLALLAVWFFTAYFVLPRIHRALSKIYVPNNFIGRSRTADGILSDPINLALNGTKTDLIAAMKAAGWTEADAINLGTIRKMISSTVLRKSYPNAPVSDAFVFGERQALAFQKEVDDNPRKRHHVRFWKTPLNWYLPGGHKVDWLGAATYDDAVGISLFTLQFTHAIAANVDDERDFLIRTLKKAKTVSSSQRIEHFFNAYKTRNGFGSHYITDGSLVIADLKTKREQQ